MYRQFFGLLENPFTTRADPKYFFLGKSHEEALLHLKYSVSQGEGFTLITGNEGIGKTTVCRAFIDRQNEQVETAFISYSKQNPLGLLSKICQAYDIKVSRQTLKDLTDAFNSFLMRKRTEGKRVVVLLDDAHKHNHDALEQLRLLSNLETTRDKLLQIVLIGRPELSDRLNSHELRPLGQRMSVSYHLQPLNDQETFDYINHRIRQAGKGAAVRFEPSAIKQIYNYSKGIPLFINSICDKALMMGFRLGDQRISGTILRAVMKDSSINPKFPTLIDSFFSARRMKLFGLGSVLILVISLLAAQMLRKNRSEILKIEKSAALSHGQVHKSQLFDVNHVDRDEIELDKKASQMNDLTPDTDEKASRSNKLAEQIYFSIQVGAFLVSDNARKMMKQLIDKGYAGRIENFKDTDGRNWHIVRIGNYPSRELAKADADYLISEYNMEAVVLPANKF